MPFFVFFYYSIIGIAHFLALPFIAILQYKPKYQFSLKKRFLSPQSIQSNAALYWFHACSFGEVQSLKPLLRGLEKKLEKNEKILITTITQTGFKLAKDQYPNAIVTYLPFESFIPFWISPLDIKALILIEAELWLLPLAYAKKKGAKTLLINARISNKSFFRYQCFGFFYRRLFCFVDEVFCQQAIDKTRLHELGAKNISIFGNIKLAQIPHITKRYVRPKKDLWVIASTHETSKQSETALILEQILIAHKQKPLPILLFAPRHPQNFHRISLQINAILKRHSLPPLMPTSLLKENKLSHPFYLLDSLGELNNFYAIAQLVILGGSFLPNIGGHNPIECAFFQTKLISGPYFFNQKALFDSIQGYVVCKLDDLSHVLEQETILPKSKITTKIHHELITNTIRASNERR